jgi:hypothetical protein
VGPLIGPYTRRVPVIPGSAMSTGMTQCLLAGSMAETFKAAHPTLQVILTTLSGSRPGRVPR